jgi:nitrile hydratase
VPLLRELVGRNHRAAPVPGIHLRGRIEQKTTAYLERPEFPLPAGGDNLIDEQVIRYLKEGDSPRRGPAETPLFEVGDRVTVKDVPATDHTRLPGYLRGRTGTVARSFEGNYRYFHSM